MRLQASAIAILTLYRARGTLENTDVAQHIGKSTKIAQTYTQRYEDAGLLKRVNPGHSPILRRITQHGRDELDRALAQKEDRPGPRESGASVAPAALMAQRRVFPLAGVWM